MAESITIEVLAADLASDVLEGIGEAGIHMGEAIVEALKGAIEAMAEFVTEAAAAQDVQTEFDAILSNSPLSSYSDEMRKMADSLSQVTAFDDEAILGAEGVLAKYGTIGKEIFPQATQATLDLAASMHTTAQGAASLLGRAFKDLEKGSASVFERSGALTKAEVDQITAMAKAGDAAGAQALALKDLEGNIGGLAEKMGSDFNGQMEIFGTTIGNIKEEMGGKLLPVLTPLIGKFNELAKQVLPELGAIIDKYVVPVMNVLVNGVSKFVDFMEFSQQPIKNFISLIRSVTGIDIGGILAPLESMANGLTQFLGGAVSSAQMFIMSEKKNMVDFIHNIIDILKPGLDNFASFWRDNGGAISGIVETTFGKVAVILGGLLGDVVTWLVEKFSQLGAWFNDNGPLITKFIQFLGDRIVEAASSFVTFWNLVKPVLDLFITMFLDMAKVVMQLLTGDLPGALTSWEKKFKDTFDGIVTVLSSWTGTILGLFGVSLPQITEQWNTFTSGIGESIGDLFNSSKDTFDAMAENISAVLTQIGAGIALWLANALVNWSTGWFSFKSKVFEVWDDIKANISDTATTIVSDISDFLANAVSKLTGAAGQFMDAGKSLIKNFASGISSEFDSIKNSIGSFVSGLISKIGGYLQDFYNFGGDIVDNIKKGIEDAWNSFVSWITGKIQSIINGILNSLGDSANNDVNVNSTVVNNSTVLNAQKQSPTQQSKNQPTKVNNNFYGPITLQLNTESDFLKAR